MQYKNAFHTQELVFTALMTALVFVATYLPHIPIPLGYAHLGDAVIFLLALLAPRRSTLVAACIGSALADLLGGFAIWIVPTLVIHHGGDCLSHLAQGRCDRSPHQCRCVSPPLKSLDGSGIYPCGCGALREPARRACVLTGTHHGGDRERCSCPSAVADAERAVSIILKI